MTDPQPPTSPAEGLDVTAIQVRLRELATAVTQGRGMRTSCSLPQPISLPPTRSAGRRWNG
jgi:hypothetical protein